MLELNVGTVSAADHAPTPTTVPPLVPGERARRAGNPSVGSAASTLPPSVVSAGALPWSQLALGPRVMARWIAAVPPANRLHAAD
eukprot:11164684-Lingulodinium_polyedra.AAC.1